MSVQILYLYGNNNPSHHEQFSSMLLPHFFSRGFCAATIPPHGHWRQPLVSVAPFIAASRTRPDGHRTIDLATSTQLSNSFYILYFCMSVRVMCILHALTHYKYKPPKGTFHHIEDFSLLYTLPLLSYAHVGCAHLLLYFIYIYLYV